MNQFFPIRRAALAMALPVLVGFALAAVADDCRPFRGQADEEVTAVELVPDGLRLTADGAGEATHLGRFTRRAVVVVYPNGTLEGTVTFVAANGDRLYADLDGGFTSATTIAGTYTFTGGTGRFADASGGADFEGVTSDGIHVALRFEGTIRY